MTGIGQVWASRDPVERYLEGCEVPHRRMADRRLLMAGIMGDLSCVALLLLPHEGVGARARARHPRNKFNGQAKEDHEDIRMV